MYFSDMCVIDSAQACVVDMFAMMVSDMSNFLDVTCG